MEDYNSKKMELNDAIQEFLDSRNIGTFSDEREMYTMLAEHIQRKGFKVEIEKPIQMPGGEELIPDLCVIIDKYVIPIELKYNNSALEEYWEDEEKCERYVHSFLDIKDSYCIFISNINHGTYRENEWMQSVGNHNYRYLWIPF